MRFLCLKPSLSLGENSTEKSVFLPLVTIKCTHNLQILWEIFFLLNSTSSVVKSVRKYFTTKPQELSEFLKKFQINSDMH